MNFNLPIGIDYSGRETQTSRTPALQVYAAFDTEEPRRILPRFLRRRPTKTGIEKKSLSDEERKVADFEGWILGIM